MLRTGAREKPVNSMEDADIGAVEVADGGAHFLRRGRKFFYLADTAWSVFTRAASGDWEHYLDHRHRQGFNALQINLLPQWDCGTSDDDILPFRTRGDGRYDFAALNPDYFTRVETMLETACARGFVPALVLLWADYVEGTWLNQLLTAYAGQSARRDLAAQTFPPDRVEPYIAYAAERLRRFRPVYLVSGDTDFPTEEVTARYLEALEIVKSVAPDSPTTLHIAGFQPELPPPLAGSDCLDFYMYQSGHLRETRDTCYKYAERFLSEPVRRPIVNGEPCYEGIAFEGAPITTAEVRRAIWTSILSGAGAGVAYGAHGIWSWHEPGREFTPADPGVQTPFNCSMPPPWREALLFDGAWDAGFARFLFERFDMFSLSPAQDLVADGSDRQIRVAANADRSRLASYVPCELEADIEIELPAAGYRWIRVDLERRRFEEAAVTGTKSRTALPRPAFTGDSLLIGEK
jgi:hypothetical protein